MTELSVPSAFAADIEQSLSGPRKFINSRYFYDKRGDAIFRRIMEMPEYYLTGCEFEIFSDYQDPIRQLIGTKAFDVIEFGAGDAYKTRILLGNFLRNGSEISYIPVDISGNVLDKLKAELSVELPSLRIDPVQDDYFDALGELGKASARSKLVIFLGSNIGNFSEKEAFDFVSRIHEKLHPGDLLLLGVDLKKDPALVLRAYNDPTGITASFNLNLLERMNTELGANFNVSAFYHYPVYDPSTGLAKSFLVSRAEQDVYFKVLERSFHFWNGEVIATELSQKYELSQLKAWGSKLDFKLEGLFMDKRSYFTDIIFRK